MNNRLKVTLAAAALLLVAAHPAAGGGAAATPQARAADALTPGVWGGRHIRFEVTERGADIEYDCAHGRVEGRIVVDARGRFNVTGMHYEERGGPVRPGGQAPGYRVRLSGVVGGSLLKLTVTRAGTRRVIGTFSLGRDREPELVKCR